MKYKIIILLLSLFTFWGCHDTPTVLTDSEKETIIRAVEEASQDYWSAIGQTYNNESFSQIKEYFDENSDSMWKTKPIALILNTGIFYKQADWLDQFEKVIENRISTTCNIIEAHYSILSDDKVLEVIKGKASYTEKDSTSVGPFPFVNTALWTNINGEWKMQFVHQSTKIEEE